MLWFVLIKAQGRETCPGPTTNKQMDKTTMLYHRKGWKEKPCTLAKKNDDGTVDLADESGSVFVTRCLLWIGEGEPAQDGWATNAETPALFDHPVARVVSPAPAWEKTKRGRPKKEKAAAMAEPPSGKIQSEN